VRCCGLWGPFKAYAYIRHWLEDYYNYSASRLCLCAMFWPFSTAVDLDVIDLTTNCTKQLCIDYAYARLPADVINIHACQSVQLRNVYCVYFISRFNLFVAFKRRRRLCVIDMYLISPIRDFNTRPGINIRNC